MKKSLEIQLKAFATADKFLAENEPIWKHIAGIATRREKYAQLKTMVDIKSVDSKSTKNNEASTTKKNMRAQLQQLTMRVVRAYRASAANLGDTQMRMQLQITQTDLDRTREIELADTSMMVYTVASARAGDLELFISAPEIERLKTLSADFKDYMVEPRLQESKGSVNTANIEEIVKEMRYEFSFIKDMVESFQDTNPDFYKGFENSLKQVRMSSRKRNNGNNGANGTNGTDNPDSPDGDTPK